MREFTLTYGGSEYRCRASYDVLMDIENKVIISSLAHRIFKGALNGEIPDSHVNWVLTCLLNGAGANVDPQKLFDDVACGNVSDATITAAMHFIIGQVYNVGPVETMPNAEDFDEDVDGEKKTA